jgi:hypothetical protein
VTAQTFPRSQWLRDEIETISRYLNEPTVKAHVPGTNLAETNVSAANTAFRVFERARRGALMRELAERQAELDGLESGGQIDLRLTGRSVQGHAIETTALAAVLGPLAKLVTRLSCEAYVQTRPGSFVLEIHPPAQQQFDDPTAMRLDPVGETLANVVGASVGENIERAVGDAVDDLSLEGVRAVKVLVRNLKVHKLDVDLRWVNKEGRIRSGRLDRDQASLVFDALEAVEKSRSEIEVVGELGGITTLGRNRRFQIQCADGSVVEGVVAKDTVPLTLGFSIGEMVIARVEETERKRTYGSTTTRRLLALSRKA